MKHHAFTALFFSAVLTPGLLMNVEESPLALPDSPLTQSDSMQARTDSALAQNDSAVTETPPPKIRKSRRAARARQANAQNPHYETPSIPAVTAPCETGSG